MAKKYWQKKQTEQLEPTAVTENVSSENMTITENITETPAVEKQVEKPVVKKQTYQVKYRRVVYLGISEKVGRIGAVTGTHYTFEKDRYGMPLATDVEERDYPSIISEKGKGCAKRSPEILFMLESDWNLELEQARIANS